MKLLLIVVILCLTFAVYAAIAGDWLQGPYVYYLYSQYGFGKGDIGQLFIAGFGSSMLFGTIVGSLADKQWDFLRTCDFVVLYWLNSFPHCFTFMHWMQGSKEGMCDVLHSIHTELHYKAFFSIQDFDVGPCFGGYRHFSPILSFWVMACSRTQQGEWLLL
jgi:hypothetical protein